MSKWEDYLNGKCTDEDYIKSEYTNCNYIGKLTKENHIYYIFKDELENKTFDCYIRDFENGHRVSRCFSKDVTKEEIFEWFYGNNDSFKLYVDTDGKCLEM